MITKQKKIVYATTLVLTTGLFANEVVNATGREAPPEPIERPAEDPSLAAPEGVQEPVAASPSEESAVEPAPQAAENSASKDPLAALEAALARLGESPSAADAEVGSFGRGRRARRAAPEENPTPTIDTQPEELTQAQRGERLEQLRQSQPLVGIVTGPEGSVALIGGRTVRVGDLLVDGDARVLECTPAGVRIEFEGEPAWLALPGLRTHAPAPRVQSAPAAPPPPAEPVANAARPAASPAEQARASQGGQP